MHRCLWKCTLVAVSFLSLSFFLQDDEEEPLERGMLLQEEKKKILQHLEQEQTNSLELLTVGISSVQRPHGSALLDTLQSLFQASSGPELHCIVVLVHLSGPDPEWLTQMAANISSLFQPHIEARELLVIHGRLGGSPVPGDPGDAGDSSPCAPVYSRQKVDYTLLMNFALNLSEYFLMIEDRVQCAPKFVSAIYWALSACFFLNSAFSWPSTFRFASVPQSSTPCAVIPCLQTPAFLRPGLYGSQSLKHSPSLPPARSPFRPGARPFRPPAP